MLTKKQIQFLNLVCPDIWTETNGVISVNGDVNMDDMNLTQIPVQFGQVTGYFSCYDNKLTSLEGIPFSVGDYFNCQKNYLTSLEGGLKKVGSSYSCSENQLTNLIGAPEICNDNFFCHNNNQLTSLEGCPNIIKRNFYCHNNLKLEYLYGIGRVEGKVNYGIYNEINEWIIKQARNNIFVTQVDIATWIKDTNNYQLLLGAPEKLRLHFSKFILNDVDFGIYY